MAYHSQQWSEATHCFAASFQRQPHALTAYLLAAAYAQLGDAWATDDYAVQALLLTPPIAEAYRDGARRLVVWARAQQHARQRVRIHVLQSTQESSGRDIIRAEGDRQGELEASDDEAEIEANVLELRELGIDPDQFRDEVQYARWWMESLLRFGDDPESMARALEVFNGELWLPAPAVAVPTDVPTAKDD